jgi:murein DD-endopeptidase MepM/ murein hydrolase activator NlpD/predicted chitinase
MENNSLTDIIKSRRETGEGVFSSIGGAAKERLKEKFDIRRSLPQGGLLTALFPKLKAYKAQKAASPTEKILKNINTDFTIFAKNSEKLKSIANNFSIMKKEVNKLAKLEKVVPATETKTNLTVRDSETTSPTKLEPEKGNNMFLLIAAVAAVGAAMALGYKQLEESFDVSINGALKSVSNLGGDLYDKLKSSFENMNFKQLIADNKSVMETEVKDSFARNKNSMLDRQLVKQIEAELNRDVASDDDAAVGAAMKANVQAQNPMNYANQDGPVTNRTTIQTAVPPTSRAPVKVPGENVISSRYGSRVMNGKTQMHEGLDIKGKTGEPIFSTGKGKANIGKENSGFGIWVIVDHGNGLQTYYGHMSQHAIENGQDVDAGTIIGYVGSTGISTGPHLHYQIMKDGKSIDPVNNNPSELKNYTFAKYGLLDITPDAAKDTSVPTPPSIQKLESGTKPTKIDGDFTQRAQGAAGAFKQLGLNNPIAMKALLAVAAKESNLTQVSEYGAEAWGNTIKNKNAKDGPGAGVRYANSIFGKNFTEQEYMNAVSKGNEFFFGPQFMSQYSGGWKYRGRGFVGLTHDYNYKTVSKIIGEDVYSNPDLVNRDATTNAKATLAIVAYSIGQGNYKKGLEIMNNMKSPDEALKFITANVAAGGTGMNPNAGVFLQEHYKINFSRAQQKFDSVSTAIDKGGFINNQALTNTLEGNKKVSSANIPNIGSSSRSRPQQAAAATNSNPDLHAYLFDKLVSNYG